MARFVSDIWLLINPQEYAYKAELPFCPVCQNIVKLIVNSSKYVDNWHEAITLHMRDQNLFNVGITNLFTMISYTSCMKTVWAVPLYYMPCKVKTNLSGWRLPVKISCSLGRRPYWFRNKAHSSGAINKLVSTLHHREPKHNGIHSNRYVKCHVFQLKRFWHLPTFYLFIWSFFVLIKQFVFTS